MSLRTRLTILYTSLVGGILLLFGLTVYQTISVILMNQIEETLIDASEEVFAQLSTNPAGHMELASSPDFNPPANVMIQVYGRGGILQDFWPMYIGRPLDPLNIQSGRAVFTSRFSQNAHLRVLTVPIHVGDYMMGTVQVAASLGVVDTTQRALLGVLLVGVIVSMSLAAIAARFSTHQVLIPLEVVTQTALQITRADDLSRRIPSYGLSDEDEIGQLIAAFNLTLGRLEQLFHTQRRFIADVGHELRTPLTVIKGNVSLMRKMGCGDEESLDSIDNEVDRLVRLVGDLLLLSQAESGKIPLDWKVVELDSVIFEVIQQMRIISRDNVQVKLGEIDQVLVCGDRDKLTQVLVNLVGNAVRYTPMGGEVVVGVRKDEGQALVRVTDTGPGIAPEDMPHIFERFYRAEKARTRARDGQGFGLGLSIAYWIVRSHGGTIDVESEVGKGTTFNVLLPLSSGDCEKKSTL